MKYLLQSIADKIIEMLVKSTTEEEFHTLFMFGMHLDNFALKFGINLD